VLFVIDTTENDCLWQNNTNTYLTKV